MDTWCKQWNPNKYHVDERRLIQYGMYHKFLRKLSIFPVTTVSPDNKKELWVKSFTRIELFYSVPEFILCATEPRLSKIWQFSTVFNRMNCKYPLFLVEFAIPDWRDWNGVGSSSLSANNNRFCVWFDGLNEVVWSYRLVSYRALPFPLSVVCFGSLSLRNSYWKMVKPILYSYWRSSCSWRVRIGE